MISCSLNFLKDEKKNACILTYTCIKWGEGGYSFNTVMVVCITFITIKTSLTLSLYTHNRKERTHSSIQQGIV